MPVEKTRISTTEFAHLERIGEGLQGGPIIGFTVVACNTAIRHIRRLRAERAVVRELLDVLERSVSEDSEGQMALDTIREAVAEDWD